MVQHKTPVDELASLTIHNEHDEVISMASLWQKGAAAIVFVRHFG